MTGITYRVGLGRNLSASEVDGNFSQLTGNKVESSAAFSGLSAGAGQLTAGVMRFSDSNGVSFGINGSTITATVKTDYLTTGANSDHSHGNPTLVLTNISGTTASNSAGLTLSLSAGVGGGGAALSAGTQSANTGTIAFANSNGLTFGMSGSSQITGSYSQSTHSHATAAFSGSNGSFTAETVTFGSSNGLHFYTTNGSIVGSYTVPAVAGLLSAINVSGGTTSNNLSALTFSDGGNVSFGLNGSVITASAPAGGGGMGVSAGTQSVSTGTLVFSNSNGITFGMSGSSRITASHNGLTTAAASDHSHGNPTLALTNISGTTASNSAGLTLSLSANVGGGMGMSAGTQSVSTGTMLFADSNGISFGMSGSSRITASYTVPSTAGLLSAVNVSAGTTSNNLSALTFGNANGISFGLDASTITASYTVPNVPAQTNQTVGLYALGNTTQNSSTTLDARTLSFNGLGAATVGYSNGSIQISVPVQSAQTQSVVQGISAGTQVGRTGDIVFSNSNGISFGLSGSSRVTASYTVPSTAGLISAINVSGGTTSNNLSAITFSNGNGVTFGLDGSTITASVAAAGGAQTGISGLANSETTYTSGSVTFSALGAITIRSTTGQQFQFSVNAQSVAPGIQTIAFANTTFTTGAVSFSNANGISFGSSGAQVTASYTVPTQTAQTVGVYASSQTYGQSSSSTVDARSLSVVGSGGVSVGMSAGSLLISGQTTAAQTNQSAIKGLGVSNTGQTAGNTGLSTGIDWVLAGSGSITLSQSTAGGGPNTVWVQHPAWITTQSAQAFSADASSTFQTLTFQDSNGVSFSNNAGALRITHELQFTSNTSAITSNALNTSASRVINIVAATNNTGGGTASLSSNVSFSAANGITFYTSAGNAIVGSHNALTTARASTDAIGLNTAQTNVTWTADSSGLSINAAGYAGTTTAVTGNAVLTLNSLGLRLDGSGLAGTSTGFTGANISGSMTHNSAGLAMSLSVAVPGGGGGVAISAGTQSVSTGTMVFADSNGLTFGMSGSSQITASYNSTQFAGTGTTFAGANISGSMTFNSVGANLSLSVAAPGAAAEQNAINLLGANTAGNTTATGSTIGMSGINLTLSGTNASQIVFSAPATSSIVGISGISLSTAGSTVSIMPADASYIAWPSNAMLNTQTQTVASNTSVVFPLELHDLERFDFIMMPATVSIASMASIATAANNTKSYTQAATFNFVLYSRGIGANSQSLQSFLSTQHTSRMTIAIGQNANGSQWTVTHAFSFPATNTAQATLSTSYATSLTNVNVSTTHLTAISGIKKLGFPWATSLPGNQYWLMTGIMTAATTNGNASLSNMRVTQSMLAQSQVNLTWAEFGSANNASIQARYGIGSYTAAATGTTNSFGFAAISSSSSHNIPYITFARIA